MIELKDLRPGLYRLHFNLFGAKRPITPGKGKAKASKRHFDVIFLRVKSAEMTSKQSCLCFLLAPSAPGAALIRVKQAPPEMAALFNESRLFIYGFVPYGGCMISLLPCLLDHAY